MADYNAEGGISSAGSTHDSSMSADVNSAAAASGATTPSNGASAANGSTAQNSRTAVTQQENAAELSFGVDFADIQILSNAQVAVYLQVSARSADNRDEELHDVYRKTQKYVDRFNTMNNKEKNFQELVDELDNLQDALTTFRKDTDDGEELDLNTYEVAALMNLVATDTLVEEAVSLIPSLSRFPETAIDDILDMIRSTMIRIVS
mmetsp:Transcript_40470/g.47363  ORF Transcript_40470/g.47363 Transcript_40470/m.47363 type:complete len:206 (+) Transcript_40470:83-700(+)|eukprot:CAMPEP_0194378832 /NCGR_PEP_ID=MMETSP0174-20130528/37119_1 /TAXON_ID=216777 /ORGANISM="Proboscia alata, Strain PI-D3" /LENGTH=205 /DNA_ID=CAMNT_0039161121 /DNA_START=77 /DNA_END=694 /DNA_ORIENTATION=-